MVAYATADEVRAAVARDLNKLTNTTASMDDQQFVAAIANAQAQVDGKLRRLYPVPFTPVPSLVKAITIDIAAYLATMNYRQEREIPEADPIVRRYNRSTDLLCHLADGLLALDVGDGTGIAARLNGIGRPIRPNAARLFRGVDFGLAPGWGPS